MARCDVCGNSYRKSFDIVTSAGKRLSFDNFECAIHRLAPARHGGETQAVDNTRNLRG